MTKDRGFRITKAVYTKTISLEGPRFSSPTVRALGALVIVLAIGLIFNADGAFFKWGTHRDMLRAVSVYGILAWDQLLWW